MGFWAALDETCPTTRQQRCWQHKTMNLTNCLPKLSQSKAKADAITAFDLFITTHEPKDPKAALYLQKDRNELRAFFDFPAGIGRASAPAIRLNLRSPQSDTGPKPDQIAA